MTINNVVETVNFETETWLNLRGREFIKNPETRDFIICAFCRIFLNVVITSKSIFFKFLAFSDGFGCFLPANTTNESCWIIEILLYHFFAIFKVSRHAALTPRRDLKPSRPRLTKLGLETRLETPSLMIIYICSLVLQQSYIVFNYIPMKYKNKFRIDRVESWFKLIFETFLLLVYFNVSWLYFCYHFYLSVPKLTVVLSTGLLYH